MLRTCSLRHFEYVVAKTSLLRQRNQVLDDIFAATYLRRLSLQIQLRLHMSSQMTLLHPIICDDELVTTCRHKSVFSDDFQVFTTTLRRRKTLIVVVYVQTT